MFKSSANKNKKGFKERAALFAKTAKGGVSVEYKKHLQQLKKEDSDFKRIFLGN